jgi:AcrR family transcriptional regulator
VARRPDRRVQRTHQLLRAALLELVREKGFEPLRVQDILDRANVGRATFYAHFDNKEDLLLSGLDGLRASLREIQRQAHARGRRPEQRLFAFTHELFAHVEGHRDVFQPMAGQRSGAVIRRVFQKMLVDLVREDVKALAPDEANSVRTEFKVRFAAGALFALLMWWLEDRPRLGVAELDARFRQLAVPVVTEGLRGSAILSVPNVRARSSIG